MHLEQAVFSNSELNRVFPFHIAICKKSSNVIVGVGASLQKVIGDSWHNNSLDQIFELARPRNTELDLDAMTASDKTFVFHHRFSPLSLRGLFVALLDNQFIFICSVEVMTQNTLKELGLGISNFAKNDPTPDIIILHQFRDLQLLDQQKQIEELRKLVVARDTFDQYANTDAMTGIGNRRHFWAQGSTMLNEVSEGQKTTILLLDLDGFKAINDTYGHDVGDEVLKVVATRCQQTVSDHGIVSRLGGDEFVALFRLDNLNAVGALVSSLMDAISAPMVCMNRHLVVRPSIGVSSLDNMQNMDEAIHYADLAMYEGRKKSKGTISWFTPEMQANEDHRKSLLSDIAQGIQNRDVIPYFQPIVDIRKQCVYGYEALARWEHPIHGLMFPGEFIELAAEAGCLHELDYWILESALDQLAVWDQQGSKFSIHVNFCGTSIRHGLDTKIMKLLSERRIKASRLMLELTETTLLEFEAPEKKILDDLAAQGVIIQLDDFGTGYSSLTHLHNFPVNGVKLDRSFLLNYPNNKRCLALIKSVLGMTQHLDMTVVTEGIETLEQLQWIESIGCRYGQGYYFGKPAPAQECLVALESWVPTHEKAA